MTVATSITARSWKSGSTGYEDSMPVHPAKSKPRTKAGKKRKVAKVMREHKRGKLRSGSGKKVTKRKQAVAIALSEAGESRKQRGKKRR
jgi:hypothetical protein